MMGKARWILVAALVAAPVDGQRPSRPGGGGPGMVDRAAAQALRLAEQLELTEAQRAELQEIRAEALAALETVERERLEVRQELRALRRNSVGEEGRSREELRAVRDEVRARMEALRERERELTGPVLDRYEGVLSSEQRLELREMRRDRWERARRPGARRPGVRGGEARLRGPDPGLRGPRWRGEGEWRDRRWRAGGGG